MSRKIRVGSVSSAYYISFVPKPAPVVVIYLRVMKHPESTSNKLLWARRHVKTLRVSEFIPITPFMLLFFFCLSFFGPNSFDVEA